ncbi:MAG: signal peptidase II [Candidatus Dasytiphilus stammeri]
MVKNVVLYEKKFFFLPCLRWLLLTFIIIVIDFYSKKLVMNFLILENMIPVGNFLNFYYVHNYGAAFNIFTSYDKYSWQYWFLIIITIISIYISLITMYKLKYTRKLPNIGWALMLGGTIGNFINRIIYGFVIDFIDLHVNNWHYPTFNLADIAIFLGIFLLLFDFFANKKIL